MGFPTLRKSFSSVLLTSEVATVEETAAEREKNILIVICYSAAKNDLHNVETSHCCRVKEGRKEQAGAPDVGIDRRHVNKCQKTL